MSWDAGPKMRPMLKGGMRRPLRYQPDGGDFVIRNGDSMFARGLYGRHSAFRVVAGDRPEFMLFGPGKRGTLRLGVISEKGSKWLTEADDILARYRAGSMIYEVRDALIGAGILRIAVLSMHDADGLIVRVEAEGCSDVELVWAFGAVCGRSFARAGDIGTEMREAFMLNAEECEGNEFTIDGEAFELRASIKSGQTRMVGVMPGGCRMHVGDARVQESPEAMLATHGADRPALAGSRTMKAGEAVYIAIEKESQTPRRYADLTGVFAAAEAYRKSIVSRVKVETPDEFMDPIGGAMAIAADACWEEPTWLHGAVAWRRRYNGWRAAYMGDTLGWHDRAMMHFSAYAKSQITSPKTGKVCPSREENLAREAKTRDSLLYSSGYISPDPDGRITLSHYDMNLVYIDALLRHLLWTGDMEFAGAMWRVIERHLAWEKRCFDADDDGLYDAYCCIWASDAVQYSGGAVAHSTAYNYYANKMAARLARTLGRDGSRYELEAAKIQQAMKDTLWLSDRGWFAEYRDEMGEKRLHESAAIWTIYHAIDSEVASSFDEFSMLRYVDEHIPHLPVEGDGVPEGLEVVSTTNWMPYTWSVNIVAMAENAHMALAYWQGGRCEEAYKLWKSTIVDMMYMGSCPGNFGQLSWLDAYRGELYSDFADVVGICSRALVEGLFGVVPDALAGELLIRPGMPKSWEHARFEIPDVTLEYERHERTEVYRVEQRFAVPMKLRLRCKARFDQVMVVTVNGEGVGWGPVVDAVGEPMIEVRGETAAAWEVIVEWDGQVMAPCLTAGSGQRFEQRNQGAMEWWEKSEGASTSIPDRTGFIRPHSCETEMVDLREVFNGNVTDIFRNEYIAPRPKTVTLQLPKNGIGNWCKYDAHPDIDDSGIRATAKGRGWIEGPYGVPFATPEKGKNIVYTSLWNNYPDSITVALGGKARQAYLMLAGSTNAMQSRFVNGEVLLRYCDGGEEVLELRNPETWWPIQEDYLVDDHAFRIDGELPWRVRLATGEVYRPERGKGGRQIPGGCATVLSIRLDAERELQSLRLAARAIDVVIGLMSLTLVRSLKRDEKSGA